MSRRHVPPFETEIERLGLRGTGIGRAPGGREVHVRAAPPGARVAVRVFGHGPGLLHARRTALIRPPAAYVEPPCTVFGLCGGCALQELALDAQRQAKAELVRREVDPPPGTRIHPVRGGGAAYGYRNKVELSFGRRRYVDEEAHAAGAPLDGRFLGFHAPGRFDRIVDAERCELVSPRANALIATLRREVLRPDRTLPYDARTHEGGWRHAVLREGFATGELLVLLHTTSAVPEAEVEAVAQALLDTPLAGGRLVGVVWLRNDHVADVVRGEAARTWGRDWLEERLGDVTLRLSPWTFFQTSTEGATVLYDTVAEAVGTGGTLVDLYCGAGSIGLYLARRHDRVVGIEEVEAAVEDARANAARNGIDATFHAAKVEDALHLLPGIGAPRRLVVDPPRAGLHPRVAEALAQAEAEVLVYVACHPPSLGRDARVLAEGGWRCTDLWTVDLFPQTGHVEAVTRFEKRPTEGP